MVSDGKIEDATPAFVVAHTRKRRDKADIVDIFHNVKPEVILGGGSAYFLPRNVAGSKRKDDWNFIEAFQKDGYAFATSRTELKKAVDARPKRLLGLFHPGNMDGALKATIAHMGIMLPGWTEYGLVLKIILGRSLASFCLQASLSRLGETSAA